MIRGRGIPMSSTRSNAGVIVLVRSGSCSRSEANRISCATWSSQRRASAAPPSRSRGNGPCVNSNVGSPIGNRQPSLPISTRNADFWPRAADSLGDSMPAVDSGPRCGYTGSSCADSP